MYKIYNNIIYKYINNVNKYININSYNNYKIFFVMNFLFKSLSFCIVF